MKRSFLLSAVCGVSVLAVFSGSPAEGAPVTIVNLGGAGYVTANQFMNGASGNSGTIVYSESTQLNPQSDYNLLAPSAIFHGGRQAVSGGVFYTSSASGFNVRNGAEGANDVFGIAQMPGGAETFNAFATLYTWSNADFLGEGDGQNAMFDEGSSLALSSLSVSSGAGKTSTVRLAVKSGNAYYVSEILGILAGSSSRNLTLNKDGASGTGFGSLTGNGINELSWFSYNPGNLAAVGSLAADLGNPVFSWVGIHLYTETTTANQALGVTFQGFQVNATVVPVPEPGTAALLIVGVAGIAWARRKGARS